MTLYRPDGAVLKAFIESLRVVSALRASAFERSPLCTIIAKRVGEPPVTA